MGTKETLTNWHFESRSKDYELKIKFKMPEDQGGFDNRLHAASDVICAVIEATRKTINTLPPNFAENIGWDKEDELFIEFMDKKGFQLIDTITTELAKRLGRANANVR